MSSSDSTKTKSHGTTISINLGHLPLQTISVPQKKTLKLTLLRLLLLLLGGRLGSTTSGSGGSTGRSGGGGTTRRDGSELGRTLSDQLPNMHSNQDQQGPIMTACEKL
jgi:hypothetical protein